MINDTLPRNATALANRLRALELFRDNAITQGFLEHFRSQSASLLPLLLEDNVDAQNLHTFFEARGHRRGLMVFEQLLENAIDETKRALDEETRTS